MMMMMTTPTTTMTMMMIIMMTTTTTMDKLYDQEALTKVFYGEASPWDPTPFQFYLPFLTEKIPISDTLIPFTKDLHPFHIPS